MCPGDRRAEKAVKTEIEGGRNQSIPPGPAKLVGDREKINLSGLWNPMEREERKE